jgi:adenosylcobinamide kinase/adenosylcobinamide-phosphate guanylyltransferase
MRKRIDAHRAERPATWDTLESPRDLAADIQQTLVDDQYSAVVIDCITLWVSNIVCSLPDEHDVEAELTNRVSQLMKVRSDYHPDQHWIVVSNEVGLGIVPDTSLGRRYRDALGRVNQLIAAAADTVTLMVAGIAVDVKK